MTVKYHCDGPDCAHTMGREERRIAITVQAPPPEMRWSDDDVDEDGNLPNIEIDIIDLYSDGDFHFCSDTCLTGWAMARALDE